MSSSVDQIKSKIDIVSLVGSYIKLEKAGANYKCRCPFHNEKTPSFFVSPDRGSYYCFGCHAKGDIFTFVQDFEKLDFVGALKILADRAGVDLDSYSKSEKTEKQRLHSVLEQAVFFYEKKLSENKQALDYLTSRGLTEKTIKEFRIGYSTLEWRELFEYLNSKDVSISDMEKVGLIKRKEGGTSTHYDTFRGRIMFPINDSSGRVVGFSGRILVSDDPSTYSGQVNAPKYLNSPETVLFNKSEILFGLDKAKKDIRLKDYSILVEGQMDLVMMHQAGITNTVASSGTALTENHLVKLQRFSNRIIVAYDGDTAGFRASDRSSQIALRLGMELKIAQMPVGKDPADLAKDNVDELVRSLKNSKHIIDFYTDTLISQNLAPRELGREIQKHVLPYVAEIPSSIEQSHFIKIIAQKAFIKEEALWDDLKKLGTKSTKFDSKAETSSPILKKVDTIEKRVIGIIFWQKANKTPISGVDMVEFEGKVRQVLGSRTDDLLAFFEKEKESLLFEIEAYYNNKTNVKEDWAELLVRLEEEHLKKEFSEAMVNLQKAEQTKNSGDVLKYLEMCQDISKKLNAIKNIYEKK